MKKIVLVLLVFVFLIVSFIFVSQLANAATISDCTEITSSNTYFLDSAIINSANTICINISADDVELDCQSYDYFIDGTDTSSTYGVYIYKTSENVTVRNCNITDWDSNIYLWQANNTNITNVSLYSSRYFDIKGYDTFNTTIKESFFNSSQENGIYFDWFDSTFLENILIEQNAFYNVRSIPPYSLSYYVINFDCPTYNVTINNNTFVLNNVKDIEMGSSENSTVSNNTFKGPVTGGISRCAIRSGANNYFLNNNLTGGINSGTTDRGICATGSNNIFRDNIVKNHSTAVFITGNNNYFYNLNVSSGTWGVYIRQASNNTIRFSNIKNNTYNIYFSESAPSDTVNNLIWDSVVNNSGSFDIVSDSLDGSGTIANNSFLNTTFDTINVTADLDQGDTNFVYVQWYLEVQVNYDNGTHVNNANVNITNISGNNLTLTTNATGWITRQNITEFFATNNSDGSATLRTYFGNHTIEAYKNPSNSTEINFSEVQYSGNVARNYFINLTLASDSTPTPLVITIISPLNQSYAAGTTNIDFNVSLNKDGSWCGFSQNGAANVSMTQFNVTYYNYTQTGLSAGTYNITFYCNDTSNSFDTASVVFGISTAAGTGGNGGTSGGGGGSTPTNVTCEPLCSEWDIFAGPTDMNRFCCAGLTQVYVYDMNCFAQTGTCLGCEILGNYVCTKCGNGLCEYCESYCSCPEDCSCELWLNAQIELGFVELFEEKEEKNILEEVFDFITGLFG